MTRPRIRVIDLESTGSAPPEHGLVEIAFCDIVAMEDDLAGAPTAWEVVGGHGRLCNPGRDIPPETSAVHHIVDEDIVGLPDWKVLLGSLLRRGPADGVVAYAAHSMNFEQSWFHPDWLGGMPLVCTYKSALRLWKDAPGHSNQTLRYWRKPAGLNRDDALPAHRAYPDALVTAHHLRDMLNEGTPLEQLIEWTKVPALTLRCRIGKYRNDGAGTPWEDVDSGFLEWILSKPDFDEDTLFTVEHHLALRRQAAAEADERASLDAQLRANGLPEGEITEAPAAAPDHNQPEFPL